jgi:hypothetical protein
MADPTRSSRTEDTEATSTPAWSDTLSPLTSFKTKGRESYVNDLGLETPASASQIFGDEREQFPDSSLYDWPFELSHDSLAPMPLPEWISGEVHQEADFDNGLLLSNPRPYMSTGPPRDFSTVLDQRNNPIGDNLSSPQLAAGQQSFLPNRQHSFNVDSNNRTIVSNGVTDMAALCTLWPPTTPDLTSESTDKMYLLHYKTSMRVLFSRKRHPEWSFYTYLLPFMERSQSYFPLRQAILAWTAIHHSSVKSEATYAPLTYYENACSRFRALLDESVDAFHPIDLAAPTPALSNPAEIVICTCLFLCRSDIMMGDLSALATRLYNIKVWLEKQSPQLSSKLSGFGLKILRWLSYLEIQLSVFHGRQVDGSLMRLVERVTKSSTMVTEKTNNYLTECFGESYPQEESREDNKKCSVAAIHAEAMTVLSRTLALRDWKLRNNGTAHPYYAELEEARAGSLRSEIRRLLAELRFISGTAATEVPSDASLSAVAKEKSLPTTMLESILSRFSIHYLLTLSTLHSCVIILSRILSPDIRNDDSCSEAVATILAVALTLRKSSSQTIATQAGTTMLPLSLFLAAVETTDEIHFDWIRGVLQELEDSGCGVAGLITSKKSVTELLVEVKRREDCDGKRVDIEMVMEDMGPKTGVV